MTNGVNTPDKVFLQPTNVMQRSTLVSLHAHDDDNVKPTNLSVLDVGKNVFHLSLADQSLLIRCSCREPLYGYEVFPTIMQEPEIDTRSAGKQPLRLSPYANRLLQMFDQGISLLYLGSVRMPLRRTDCIQDRHRLEAFNVASRLPKQDKHQPKSDNERQPPSAQCWSDGYGRV